MVEGEDVRDAISEHDVNGADRPTTDITIRTIDVFTDNENSIVMLKPTGRGTGTTNVTVTVTDTDGNSHTETFEAQVAEDVANSQPYLSRVTVPDRFPPGIPATLQLSSVDVEGDEVSYSAAVVSSGTGATASITQSGLLTVQPAFGFVGQVRVMATVRPGPGVTGNSTSDSDNQVFEFNFEGEDLPPSNVDLLASSDTGASDSDNITNAESLSFLIEDVSDGAIVQLVDVQSGVVLGEANASGTTAVIMTSNIAAMGDGVYQVSARQVIGGQTGMLLSPLTITYDTTAPTQVVPLNPTATVGRQYRIDLDNSEEGFIAYTLMEAPIGARIDPLSGVIEWTPPRISSIPNLFTVGVTDLAGNEHSESFVVAVTDVVVPPDPVTDPLVEVKLVARDSDGNEVTELMGGQTFTLEFIGVDRRPFGGDGVFALYADVLFNEAIIRPLNEPIERIGDFNLVPDGRFLPGEIDELGAASRRLTASNETESLIARVPMQAVGTGLVTLTSEPADIDAHEVLLFGVNHEIRSENVVYGTLELTVGAGPDVSFVADEQSTLEGSRRVSSSIQLSHASDEDIVIPFSVSGTATLGVDFDTPNFSVTIPAGTTRASIPFDLIDDGVRETNETIVVELNTPLGAFLTDSSAQTVTILANDGAEGDNRIMMPEQVTGPLVIPGDGKPTAVLFRAEVDLELTVTAIGTVSLNETVTILDRDLVEVTDSAPGGGLKAQLQSGGLYALMFDASASQTTFLVKSSAGPGSLTSSVRTNLFERGDVDANGELTPRDALMVINQLGRGGEGETGSSVGRYLDANGDGKVSPIDALWVINRLAQNMARQISPPTSQSQFFAADDSKERDVAVDEAIRLLW